MPKPLVFISYDLDHDENAQTQFAEQTRTCPVPFSIEDWSTKPGRPLVDWERSVRGKVDRSSLMIVLVGRQMESSSGVEREIQFAKGANVPYFGVYVDGADAASKTPAGLPANRIIPCDLDRIGSAIAQLMAEGKHHIFS